MLLLNAHEDPLGTSLIKRSRHFSTKLQMDWKMKISTPWAWELLEYLSHKDNDWVLSNDNCHSLSSWQSQKCLESHNYPWLFSCVADYSSLHLQCGAHQIVSPQHGSAVWLPPELYWRHGPLHVHLWLLQTIQHSPLLISENSVVFLWNNTGFNFKVKKTLTLHKTFEITTTTLHFSVLFVKT